jgi:hypothetical protein
MHFIAATPSHSTNDSWTNSVLIWAFGVAVGCALLGVAFALRVGALLEAAGGGVASLAAPPAQANTPRKHDTPRKRDTLRKHDRRCILEAYISAVSLS